MKIIGNMIGGSGSMSKTYILEDENGNQVVGVLVDNLVLFDAKDEDVKKGKIYASDQGISTGTHEC